MTTRTPGKLALVFTFLLPIVVGADKVVEVEIFEYQFIPEELTIEPGTTVRWVNNEKRQFHNVWFQASGEEPVEYLFPGDTYEKRFEHEGEYPYVCKPHEKRMSGRIVVKK